MPKYCIGLDLGTTSTKAVALSPDCHVLALASTPNRMFSTSVGSSWQDPKEIWMSGVRALSELSKQIPAVDALGICLSGAMHSLFPSGPGLDPLFPAVTWADIRAGENAEGMRRRCNAHELYFRTGCPLQYLYYPAKLRRWIEENPALGKANFSAIKDYVIYQLTGEWVTDMGLASSTGLMDTRLFCWDDEALALSGIHSEQLPKLVSPDAVVGGLTRESSGLTGFLEGLPVIAGAGDGGLANLGAGAVRPGQTIITVGTSGAVRRIASEPQLDQNERTWCYLLMPGRWFHGGATNNAGLAVQWVRERFYPDVAGGQGFDRLFEDAAKMNAGADGVVIAPYFAGERNPHWDAGARAVIYGLALEHDRRHVARAVLEGVGFCLIDIWDAMDKNPMPDEPVRLTGMINSRPIWAQILADQLGCVLAGLEAADASAIGAGMLGLIGLAQHNSFDQLASMSKATVFYQPNVTHHTHYQAVKQQFRATYSIRKATLVMS